MSVFDNMKAASGTGTARGTFPIIKNSANGKMKNLKLFGASTKAEGQIESKVIKSVYAHRKNFLQNTATTLTKDGLTFTVHNDGSVTVNGTATVQTYFVVLGGNKGREKFLGIKEIILSGCPSGGSYDKYYLQFYHYDKNNTLAYDYGSGAKLTFTNDTGDFNVSIIVKSGVTMNNVKFYPMIRSASIENADYEPYEANIANLPEAIEMNGIGELKDYIDYERGVFVQKFGVAVFDGSDDELWYLTDTNTANIERMAINSLKDKIKIPQNNSEVANVLCTQFETLSSNRTYTLNEGISIQGAGDGQGQLQIYSEDFNTTNVSLWKAHLAANPVTIVYELEEPIETPLSPAALLELNKLRTFDSTTCVSNDAGAEMEIEYFNNNATGQAMSDIHAGVPRFVLDGTTLNIIV